MLLHCYNFRVKMYKNISDEEALSLVKIKLCLYFLPPKLHSWLCLYFYMFSMYVRMGLILCASLGGCMAECTGAQILGLQFWV